MELLDTDVKIAMLTKLKELKIKKFNLQQRIKWKFLYKII